ncbi:hypothetical protein D3C71_611740 [compost metagenome]
MLREPILVSFRHSQDLLNVGQKEINAAVIRSEDRTIRGHPKRRPGLLIRHCKKQIVEPTRRPIGLDGVHPPRAIFVVYEKR